VIPRDILFKVLPGLWTLHLSDERYQLIQHEDRDTWKVAMAAITIAGWRLKHGV
jgi:hypothetical protein